MRVDVLHKIDDTERFMIVCKDLKEAQKFIELLPEYVVVDMVKRHYI